MGWECIPNMLPEGQSAGIICRVTGAAKDHVKWPARACVPVYLYVECFGPDFNRINGDHFSW